MGDRWQSALARLSAQQVDDLASLLAADVQHFAQSPRVSLVVYGPDEGLCSLELVSHRSKPVVLRDGHPLVARALEPMTDRGLPETARALAQSGVFLLALRASLLCGTSHYLAYSDGTYSSAVLELHSGVLRSGYSMGARGTSEYLGFDGRHDHGSGGYAQRFDDALAGLSAGIHTREELFERYYASATLVLGRQLS
jgi:hypothetical protein